MKNTATSWHTVCAQWILGFFRLVLIETGPLFLGCMLPLRPFLASSRSLYSPFSQCHLLQEASPDALGPGAVPNFHCLLGLLLSLLLTQRMEPSPSRFYLHGSELRGAVSTFNPVPAHPRHMEGAGSQVNWRTAACALHAMSCSSSFLLSWGTAGRVFLKLKFLLHGFVPDHSFALDSGRSLFSPDFCFGPVGLRPALPHPSPDLSAWLS